MWLRHAPAPLLWIHPVAKNHVLTPKGDSNAILCSSGIFIVGTCPPMKMDTNFLFSDFYLWRHCSTHWRNACTVSANTTPPRCALAVSMARHRCQSWRISFGATFKILQNSCAVCHISSGFSQPKLYTPPGSCIAAGRFCTASRTHVMPRKSRAENPSSSPSCAARSRFSGKLPRSGRPSPAKSYIHVARSSTALGAASSTRCSISRLCCPYTLVGCRGASSVNGVLPPSPVYT